eukprot:Hpha_TRINITY_DN15557_c4_g2::TRINITY_DN15557_c4_g2_i2::g.104770::m.104770
MLDDTKVDTPGGELLLLSNLRNNICGKWPRLGVHRLLVVDTLGHRGHGGWFFAGGGGGESAGGDYDLETRGLATHFLTQGLLGAAQPKDGSLAMPDEKEQLSCEQVVDYIARRVTKHVSGEHVWERNRNHELVGDDFVCLTVLQDQKTRQEEKEASEQLKAPSGAAPRFWAMVSLNQDFSVPDTDMEKYIQALLSKAGRTPVVVQAMEVCPWVDYELVPEAGNLRDHAQDEMRAAAAEFSSPHTVKTAFLEQPIWAPLPAPLEGGSELELSELKPGKRGHLKSHPTDGEWAREQRWRVRVELDSAPQAPHGDIRLSPPHSDPHGMNDFVKSTRKRVRREWAEGPGLQLPRGGVKVVQWRQWCVIRGTADAPGLRRLVKLSRNGALRKAAPHLSFEAFGILPKEDTRAIEKQLRDHADQRKQQVMAERKKSQMDAANTRARELARKEAAALREHIHGRMERVIADPSAIASGSDVAFLFSLIENKTLCLVVDGLLRHCESIPSDDLVNPIPDPGTAPGQRFLRRLVDWDVWVAVSGALGKCEEASKKDEDVEAGQECGGDAVAVLLRLLLATMAAGGRVAVQLTEHEAAVVSRSIVRKWKGDPAVVRWGVPLLKEFCRAVPSQAARLLSDSLSVGVGVAPAGDPISVTVCLLASAFALSQLSSGPKDEIPDSEQERLEDLARFALSTFQWAGSCAPSPQVAACVLAAVDVLTVIVRRAPFAHAWVPVGLPPSWSPFPEAGEKELLLPRLLSRAVNATSAADPTPVATLFKEMVDPDGTLDHNAKKSSREQFSRDPAALGSLIDALTSRENQDGGESAEPSAPPLLLCDLVRGVDALLPGDPSKASAELRECLSSRSDALRGLLPRTVQPGISRQAVENVQAALEAFQQ